MGRNLYTDFDAYRNRGQHLTGAQNGMTDMGFAGDGDLVVSYKRNKINSWMYRGKNNSDIESQRMVNEWGIRFINKKCRMCLESWPF